MSFLSGFVDNIRNIGQDVKDTAVSGINVFSNVVNKAKDTLTNDTSTVSQFFRPETLNQSYEKLGQVSGIKQATQVVQSIRPTSNTEALKSGMLPIGNRYIDPNFVGSLEDVGSKVIKNVVSKVVSKVEGGKTQIGSLIGIGTGLGVLSGLAEKTRTQVNINNGSVIETKTIQGTNYDPLDPSQNDPNRDPNKIGIGSAGALMTSDMIAVPRKPGGKPGEPLIPYGTIVFIPKFNRNFLVADIKGEGASMSFDFVTPHTGSKIDPKYNQSFTYKIIETGKQNEDWGKADARKKAKDLSWKTK